jgi:hypothetical protein
MIFPSFSFSLPRHTSRYVAAKVAPYHHTSSAPSLLEHGASQRREHVRRQALRTDLGRASHAFKPPKRILVYNLTWFLTCWLKVLAVLLSQTTSASPLSACTPPSLFTCNTVAALSSHFVSTFPFGAWCIAAASACATASSANRFRPRFPPPSNHQSVYWCITLHGFLHVG